MASGFDANAFRRNLEKAVVKAGTKAIQSRIDGVPCPVHGTRARSRPQGTTIRDVRVSAEGLCCEAHRKAVEAKLRK